MRSPKSAHWAVLRPQSSVHFLLLLLLLSYLCQLKSQFKASNYALEIENYETGQCLTIQDVPNFSLPKNIVLVNTSILSLFHKIPWKAIVSEGYPVNSPRFPQFLQAPLNKDTQRRGFLSLDALCKFQIQNSSIWLIFKSLKPFFVFVLFFYNNNSW